MIVLVPPREPDAANDRFPLNIRRAEATVCPPARRPIALNHALGTLVVAARIEMAKRRHG